MRILLVCFGNICRSPMAGGILASRAAQSGLKLEVRTAGVYAQTGLGLSEHAVGAMREIDIDISRDHPRQLDRELVAWADVIVPMERAQGSAIEALFAGAALKLRTLATDIEDPYGSDLATYRECRDRIADQLESLISRL